MEELSFDLEKIVQYIFKIINTLVVFSQIVRLSSYKRLVAAVRAVNRIKIKA